MVGIRVVCFAFCSTEPIQRSLKNGWKPVPGAFPGLFRVDLPSLFSPSDDGHAVLSGAGFDTQQGASFFEINTLGFFKSKLKLCSFSGTRFCWICWKLRFIRAGSSFAAVCTSGSTCQRFSCRRSRRWAAIGSNLGHLRHWANWSRFGVGLWGCFVGDEGLPLWALCYSLLAGRDMSWSFPWFKCQKESPLQVAVAKQYDNIMVRRCHYQFVQLH